jgi:hypothetical protein
MDEDNRKSKTSTREVLRESKYRKQQGVVLKNDFEKAYDKVNWSFLFDCCSQKGFSDSWLVWIRKVVTNGTLSVKVNDNVGPYFAVKVSDKETLLPLSCSTWQPTVYPR